MAKRGKLWVCNGYWKESTHNPFEGMVVCDAEWDENEDWEDDRIFFYTDGNAVIGDHGDFVLTSAEEYTPDWWVTEEANNVR